MTRRIFGWAGLAAILALAFHGLNESLSDPLAAAVLVGALLLAMVATFASVHAPALPAHPRRY
jgi:hypothetical protein